jgi:hypothetical protein
MGASARAHGVVGRATPLYLAVPQGDHGEREATMAEGDRGKRSEAARKAAAARGVEAMREAARKGAAKRTREERSESARKAAAARSPEQRREVALRAAETRRRNKEAGAGGGTTAGS